jgi:hypothetical protein
MRYRQSLGRSGTPVEASPAAPKPPVRHGVRVEGIGSVSASGKPMLVPEPPASAPPARPGPNPKNVPVRRRTQPGPVVRRGRVTGGRVIPGALTDQERAELASWRRLGGDYDLLKKVTQW